MNKKEFKKRLKRTLKNKIKTEVKKKPNIVKKVDIDKRTRIAISKLTLAMPREMDIGNWKDMPKPKKFPKKIEVTNFPKQKEFPKEIRIANFPKQKEFPKIKIPKPLKKISIRKPKWWKGFGLKQFVDDIGLVFEGLLVKLQKPENAIAVRLTERNRDKFYNAVSNAIAAGSFEVVGIKDSEGNRIDPARHLDVNKAISALTQDLAASAYSATTDHENDYRFSGFFVKFSSTQSRTITISITDGTVSIPIWTKASDASTSRVFVPDKSWELPADWELKVEITKTAGACLADILLLTTNN